jgi:heat-inducible transcriptional repressor
MRTLSTIEQEERKRRLLQAVIHQYIKTGKPVGSAFLAGGRSLDLSPATIRNVMGELEREGYLTHPHTSAGRVPTDKAYRFYVDSLVELQRLAIKEEERIRQEHESRIREINELMLSTSKTLSVLSNYTGFVTAPGIDQSQLQHMELIPLDSHRLLAVMVSDTGVVKHRQVVFDGPYPRELLEPLEQTLNQRLRGQPFTRVRETLLDHIEAIHQRQMDMLEFARHVTEEAFAPGESADIYVEGAGNILSLPEFSARDDLRQLVHFLDEKRALGDLIREEWGVQGSGARFPAVRVSIGSENRSPDMKNVSLISSCYSLGDRQVGVLGIIGPKRMEYSRMMNLVNQMAQAVTTALNRMVGGPHE